jgi:hypothetical protein
MLELAKTPFQRLANRMQHRVAACYSPIPRSAHARVYPFTEERC